MACIIAIIYVLIPSNVPNSSSQSQKIDKETENQIKEYFTKLNDDLRDKINREMESQRILLHAYQSKRQKSLPSEHSSTLFDTFYSPTPTISPCIEELVALPGACRSNLDFYSTIISQPSPHQDHDEGQNSGEKTHLNAACFPCPRLRLRDDNHHHDHSNPFEAYTDDGREIIIPKHLVNPIAVACADSETQYISAVTCQTSYYSQFFHAGGSKGKDKDKDHNNQNRNTRKKDATRLSEDNKQTLHFIPCEFAHVDGQHAFWVIYGLSFVVTILTAPMLRWRLEIASRRMMSKIR